MSYNYSHNRIPKTAEPYRIYQRLLSKFPTGLRLPISSKLNMSKERQFDSSSLSAVPNIYYYVSDQFEEAHFRMNILSHDIEFGNLEV